MLISVASGKGGTGKTTVAVSLAASLHGSVYIDCDVEEPNGHLLLKPEIQSEVALKKLLPVIDYAKCNFCGKCVDVCEYNALLNFKTEIVLLEELCHSCGACSYLCPENAITEEGKIVGFIREGISKINDVKFIDGILNIGEAASTPLIKEVKAKALPGRINIIDSPPGTSCSMVEVVRDVDFCILVTEPTPFGLHDLKLAVDVLLLLKVPFGVIINKYDDSFKELEKYLDEMKILILLKIPFNKKIAEDYS
ncbi:MAG: ATP-binding protein, partial [Ignavibacteriaceae bacterium]|nr:ATP-binding protein [Ignavibacteriaceae bacterium]